MGVSAPTYTTYGDKNNPKGLQAYHSYLPSELGASCIPKGTGLPNPTSLRYHFFISWPSLGAICLHASNPAPFTSYSRPTLNSIEQNYVLPTPLKYICLMNSCSHSYFLINIFSEYKRNMCSLQKICKQHKKDRKINKSPISHRSGGGHR